MILYPSEIKAALRSNGITVHSATADPDNPTRVVIWLEGYQAQSGSALALAARLPGVRSARIADADQHSPVLLVVTLDP